MAALLSSRWNVAFAVQVLAVLGCVVATVGSPASRSADVLKLHDAAIAAPFEAACSAAPVIPQPEPGEWEELLKNHTTGRFLQSASCNPQLIWVVQPGTYANYISCTEAKKAEPAMQMNIAGADAAISSQCWCEHDMKSLVEEIDCCSHDAFSLHCTTDCNSDCQSAEALSCLENCPAICLETDYAPESCVQGCPRECWKHILCITSRSVTDTQAGVTNLLCDDASFDLDLRVNSYLQCFMDSPLRTNWHRQNARGNCLCEADVKAAADQHNCCGASWARDVCQDTCLTEAECSTAEATQCLEDCRTKCGMVKNEDISQGCVAWCFKISVGEGPCFKYKSCKPMEAVALEYVCGDGVAPQSNGCCKLPATGPYGNVLVDGCPLLCDDRKLHSMPHGSECQCFGCPEDKDAATTKMKRTVLSQLWEQGQADLLDIARNLGLTLGPTSKMQELMAERNVQLEKIIDEHEGDVDQTLQVKLNQEAATWRETIKVEALAFKECEKDKDAAQCEEDQMVSSTTSAPVVVEASGNFGMIVVVAGVVVGLALLLGILLVVYKLTVSKGAAAAAQQSAYAATENINTMDADSTVVVGRPVANDAAAGAAAGAPVQPSTKNNTTTGAKEFAA